MKKRARKREKLSRGEQQAGEVRFRTRGGRSLLPPLLPLLLHRIHSQRTLLYTTTTTTHPTTPSTTYLLVSRPSTDAAFEPRADHLFSRAVSGRGKGGKGLGKGGAKRHRKIVSCRDRQEQRSSKLTRTNSFVTTSRASPSPPSAVSHVVEESSVSLDSSTRRPAASSRSSSRVSLHAVVV